MKQNKRSNIFSYSCGTAIVWTLVFAGLLSWNISEAKKQTITQATIQTRSFFQEFLITRFWNAFHGGLYVPITEETPPNPYLDDSLRDITTIEGLKLTKINPAYMTRQIAVLNEKRGNFQIHITSLDPISSDNEPDPWEKKALEAFLSDSPEEYELLKTDKGEQVFKYMAPLVFEKPCITCHEKYNGAQGNISGGISITLPADALIASRNRQILLFTLALSSIWLIGLVGTGFVFTRLRQQERTQDEIIGDLEGALAEVKQLSGLLPICCSCKKIRDDKGYWQTLEKYISEHSQAQFSHSLCKECAFELYPEEMEKIESRPEEGIEKNGRKQ